VSFPEAAPSLRLAIDAALREISPRSRCAYRGDKIVLPGSPAKAFTPRAGDRQSQQRSDKPLLAPFTEQEEDILASAEAEDKKVLLKRWLSEISRN